LQGGSLVFDQVFSKYSILHHAKDSDAHHWRTSEADNGPWAAAGPSPNFRIGFGDYFDCDSLPQEGISVMAWSESVTGQQPWQTWARIIDLGDFWEDLIDIIEDEIENLLEAFSLQELPMPRTPEKIAEFEAHIDELRQRLTQAQDTREKNRARPASNP
jgi:hypothetical protein